MGGNALKNCVTRRYGADEYFQLDHKVFMKLAPLFGETQVSVYTIDAYRAKESFGDLDILLGCGDLPSDWVQRIVEEFKPKEWVKNGNVLSFEFKEFQIDIINTPVKEFETSKNYFAWNDLGNLLGRLAASMNLKLGHDGLSYVWKEGTQQFKKEVISTNWETICNVLGVSYARYCEGFDELQDIFEFVVSSPFFNKEIFLLENRNNYARTRDKKRPTYTKFLTWIESYEETIEQNANEDVDNWHKQEGSGKSHWLPYLFRGIEGFEETYIRVNAEWEFEKGFKVRYNGDVVRTVTGLDKQELGKFMKWVRENNDTEVFKKLIVKMNPEVVDAFIAHWYKVYTGNLSYLEIHDIVFDRGLNETRSK